MEIREHKGFGHGLRPGEASDMNCLSCRKEDGTLPTSSCQCCGTPAGRPCPTWCEIMAHED